MFVAPSYVGDNLILSNLTGHPCVVLPNGFPEEGMPTSTSFVGQLFGEVTLLSLAKKSQDATHFRLKHRILNQ